MSVRFNSMLAIVSKAISLLAGFLLIPLMINHMGARDYGVWATLMSVCGWLALFDLGVGNSFKNTVAKGVYVEIAREYNIAASLYIYIAILFVVLLLLGVFFIGEPKIGFNYVLMLYLPVCVFFPLKIFGYGIQGVGKVGINSFVEASRLIVYLLVLVFYFKNFDYSFSGLIFIFTISSMLPILCQIVIYRRCVRSNIVPVLQTLSTMVQSEGFRLGVRFFSLQLSSLLLFGFGNVVAYNFFSLEDVATYDVYNKVYVAGLSFFNMIIAVVWPRMTKLYSEGSSTALLGLYFYLIKAACVFALGVLVVTLNFELVLSVLRVKNKIYMNNFLLLSIAVLVVMQAFSYCGAVVMNATGKLASQIKVSILSIVCIFPVFLLFWGAGIGVAAYPLASGLLVTVGVVMYNLDAYKIIKGIQ